MKRVISQTARNLRRQALHVEKNINIAPTRDIKPKLRELATSYFLCLITKVHQRL